MKIPEAVQFARDSNMQKLEDLLQPEKKKHKQFTRPISDNLRKWAKDLKLDTHPYKYEEPKTEQKPIEKEARHMPEMQAPEALPEVEEQEKPIGQDTPPIDPPEVELEEPEMVEVEGIRY